MARPKKEIDSNQVESLAAINCTVDEIASVLDCNKRTLERRFAAVINEGREKGKMSLMRLMYDKAKQGNVTMMIWLSKNILGYTDKVEQKFHSNEPQIIQVRWADEDDRSQDEKANSAPTADRSID